MQMGRGKHVRNQKINSKRQGSGGCGKLPRWNRERAIRSSVCPSVPEGCQEARLTENIGNAARARPAADGRKNDQRAVGFS